MGSIANGSSTCRQACCGYHGKRIRTTNPAHSPCLKISSINGVRRHILQTSATLRSRGCLKILASYLTPKTYLVDFSITHTCAWQCGPIVSAYGIPATCSRLPGRSISMRIGATVSSRNGHSTMSEPVQALNPSLYTPYTPSTTHLYRQVISISVRP